MVDVTFTVPKLRLVALSVRVGVDAPRLIAVLFAIPPALAVSVAVCAVLTAEMVAEKLALVAPAATVIEAGTVTAVELLASVTACPLVPAAVLSVTVQASAAAPVTDAFVQESAAGTGVADAEV